MIVQRFRSIGWVAGCALAALGCYLASQSVAAERAALARVDRDIAATQDEIKRLNTEIAARGRMGQIERWNHDVLALQAPAPGQFVASEVQLASLAGGRPLPLDPGIVAAQGAVRTIVYQAPAPAAAAAPIGNPGPVPAAMAAPAQPLLRTAAYVRARPERLDAVSDIGLVKASLTRIDGKDDQDGAPKAKTAKAKAAGPAPAAKPATLKVALADPARPGGSAGLLPSDLGSLIAAEKKAAKAAARPAER